MSNSWHLTSTQQFQGGGSRGNSEAAQYLRYRYAFFSLGNKIATVQKMNGNAQYCAQFHSIFSHILHIFWMTKLWYLFVRKGKSVSASNDMTVAAHRFVSTSRLWENWLQCPATHTLMFPRATRRFSLQTVSDIFSNVWFSIVLGEPHCLCWRTGLAYATLARFSLLHLIRRLFAFSFRIAVFFSFLLFRICTLFFNLILV